MLQTFLLTSRLTCASNPPQNLSKPSQNPVTYPTSNVILTPLLLQGYDMLKMFLLTSLLTCTSTLPILAGLLRGDVASRLVTPVSVLFGCVFSFVSLLFWGIYQSQHMGLSYKDAMHHVFLDAYDWQPFLIALLASVVSFSGI